MKMLICSIRIIEVLLLLLCIYKKSFISFTFVIDYKLIEEIRMVTDTEAASGCEDCLKLKICQGDGCCLSPSLGDFALGTTRILSGSDLGECITDAVKINTSLPIGVSFNHENTDGWKGNKAIINTGAVTYECLITKWLDDEVGDCCDTSFATKCDVKFKCKLYIGSASPYHTYLF